METREQVTVTVTTEPQAVVLTISVGDCVVPLRLGQDRLDKLLGDLAIAGALAFGPLPGLPRSRPSPLRLCDRDPPPPFEN